MLGLKDYGLWFHNQFQTEVQGRLSRVEVAGLRI